MSTPTVGEIDTVVGVAQVLHRLALGVECLDAVTGRRLRTAVRIGREVQSDQAPPVALGDPPFPCTPLTPRGIGRATATFDHNVRPWPPRTERPEPPGPRTVVVRVDDVARRVVPRRIRVPLWTLAEILAADAADPGLRAATRSLRPWLWPGSAAALPRGTTALRGRVVTATGDPVRWARLVAVRVGDTAIGHGHADDRGEFLVVLADTGTLAPPAPSTLDVQLRLTAPDPGRPPPTGIVLARDPYPDLVVEDVARRSDPPLPGELDNDVLRGLATPAGYLPNATAVPALTVPVGVETTLATPIPFSV